jgi:CRP/FNR family transcriptional regulator, cyclic AMP receptor protein
MDVQVLMQTMQTLNVDDAFKPRFDAEQWRIVLAYMARHELRSGQLLMRQGDIERSMVLVQEGTLQVFLDAPPPGKQRLAILRAGSVVGEPSLFSLQPRMANVETMTPCTVWELGGPRLDQMCTTKPALALELLRAAGAVMAVRMRANLERGMPLA